MNVRVFDGHFGLGQKNLYKFRDLASMLGCRHHQRQCVGNNSPELLCVEVLKPSNATLCYKITCIIERKLNVSAANQFKLSEITARCVVRNDKLLDVVYVVSNAIRKKLDRVAHVASEKMIRHAHSSFGNQKISIYKNLHWIALIVDAWLFNFWNNFRLNYERVGMSSQSMLHCIRL